ncbi:MAG TPA: MYXO-CTERM sorting domain-containing protein, partial [Myxococcus sp.]|nr:MYXO-CTERM sorting domain-containing protein [Myxococcus sp.]
YVLSTSRLTAGGNYSLTVTGARTSEGGTAAQPVTAAFKVPDASTPPSPEDPAPVDPVDPITPQPQPQPQLPPAQVIDDAQPQAASCSAAAGGSLAWAGLMVAALAVRRRRRSR